MSRRAGVWDRVRRPPARRAWLLLPVLVLLSGHALGSFWQFNLTRWLVFAVAGVAVVVLTGWVGQISLMPATFVGISAFTVGRLVVDQATPLVVSAALAVGIAAVVATLIGVVALRIRGLYFAIVTLVFAAAFSDVLFRREWFTSSGNTVTVPRPVPLEGDFAVFATVVVVVTVLVWFLHNLEHGRVARACFGVRDNPVAATALRVNVTKYRLFAFALHGAVAGLAGVLLGLLLQTVSAGGARPFFGLETSLAIIFFTVVGGLRSLWGPLLGGFVYYVGLGEALRALGVATEDVDGYRLLLFGLLVAGVLIASPQGMVGLLERGWRRLSGPTDAWERARPLPTHAPEPAAAPGAPNEPAGATPATARADTPALEAEGITVRFGGVHAVDDVSLTVAHGEIVGLIGPNGAGKTTLMNAVSGLVAHTARALRVEGRELSDLMAYERAGAGLGRTFQAVRLFPSLTVLDNLRLAGHQRLSASFVAAGFGLPASRREATELDAHIAGVLDTVDLGEYLTKPAGELSFGTLRMLELACLLVLQPRVLLLDEPSSGLAQRESEALAAVLLRVRRELDASMLLIEHDMPLVMGLADRVYALQLGRVLAVGTPQEVQANPAVLESYLGSGRYRVGSLAGTGASDA